MTRADRIAIGMVLATLLSLWLYSMAYAQVHQHPTENIYGETAKFYERWDRIDAPGLSCCSKQDCYSAPAKMVGGTWFFLRREDERWMPVSTAKVETRYDSPDGRAHVCAPPPPSNTVYCFLPAGGA